MICSGDRRAPARSYAWPPRRHRSPTQWQVGSPRAFHETIIVRVEADKESGAGRGANWTCESSRTRNQQCQLPVGTVQLSDRSNLAVRSQGLRRGSWLGLAGSSTWAFPRFRWVVGCVMVMTVRQLYMVCGRLVFTSFVVSGRFFVVPCCVFVIFCRFMRASCAYFC
jgi:hypothetical protein